MRCKDLPYSILNLYVYTGGGGVGERSGGNGETLEEISVHSLGYKM
jgi:hypothetical protein